MPKKKPAVDAPKRAPSAQENAFAEFQLVRESAMRRHGVDPVPDLAYQPAFVNVMLKPIIAACVSEEEMGLVFIEYCISDWPSRFSPPWCFQAFVSPKVWTPLLDDVRRMNLSARVEMKELP